MLVAMLAATPVAAAAEAPKPLLLQQLQVSLLQLLAMQCLQLQLLTQVLI
jgi:hypothetical protein